MKTEPFLLKMNKGFRYFTWNLKNNIRLFIPNREENLKYCFSELLKIIETNKLIIDIAYLKKRLYTINEINNDLMIIFCYLPIKNILKVIEQRNENSLLNNKPLEYRHPIHTLNHYINYSNIDNSVIRLEQLQIADIEKKLLRYKYNWSIL